MIWGEAHDPACRQIKPRKLISFRLVPSGRLLNFLVVVHPRPPDLLEITAVTVALYQFSVSCCFLPQETCLHFTHPGSEGEESQMAVLQETVLG